MREIVVVGAGYVGLVTSTCLAHLGHKVTCIEKDPRRLASLRDGQTPIFEPGLDEMLWEQVEAGRLSFTDDYAAAIPSAEFCFIAVNTPPGEDGAADTTNVFACVDSVLPYARPGLILVIKSTVPVGTGDEVSRCVRESGVEGVRVVSNPEFLRQSSAIKDFLAPDRVVIGGRDRFAAAEVESLYTALDAPVILCGHRSAELAKYAANTYLATRLSFINEIAGICDVTGADILEVTASLGLDHRVGTHYLQAGLGWGGSCLPKDVLALRSTAARHGYTPSILEAVEETNYRLPRLALDRLAQVANLGPGSVVGVWGLAFKPDTDDIRGAPAVRVLDHLVDIGCEVRAHDPMAMEAVSVLHPGVRYCDSPYEAAESSDALVLVTEWREYVEADWPRVRELMRGPTIMDGRNALDADLLLDLGFSYLSIGRGTRLSRSDQARGIASGARVS